MAITSFPVVGGQVAASAAGGDSSAKMEPGTIIARRTATDQFQLLQYVQLDNDGISQGEVAVWNFATLKQYSVQKAATTDEGAPMCGVALGTIASQKFGYIIIGGYCETADLSHTAASGEYLCLSGSTAGKLTPHKASAFNLGTQGNASQFMVVAVARTAIGTGTGSVSICSVWGA